VNGNAPNGTRLDLTAFQALASNPTALVDELDRLMMHNTLSPAVKTSIITAVSSVASSNPTSRTQIAFYLVGSSSQYQIAR
jgi:hypothetical protein